MHERLMNCHRSFQFPLFMIQCDIIRVDEE